MATDRNDEAPPADEPGTSTGTADQSDASSAEDPGAGARDVPFADNLHGLVDDILEGVRNFTPVASVRYPRYDFVETPDAYLLVFDVPGVERGAISVTTEGEDVVLSGGRPSPEWGEESTVRRRERPFGSFRRTIRMPADVRIDDIRARLEHGVLTVTLPRHTESTTRKVDIEG